MISQKEWEALPQKERDRRIAEFMQRMRQILASNDRETCVAALKAVAADTAKGG